MMELTHVSLLFIALTMAKIGIIDRRAELLVFPASMVTFAAFALGSFSTRPSFGAGSAINQPGLFVLGLGGTLLMLVFTVLAALDRLPEPTDYYQGTDAEIPR